MMDLLSVYTYILGGLILLIIHYYYVIFKKNKYVKEIPGKVPWPLVGNAMEMASLGGPYEIFQKSMKYITKYGNFSKGWVAYTLAILIATPQNVETILSDNTILKKGNNYKYLIPWLGTGLLNSSGQKWRRHRKLITPTFHFKILETFLSTFCSNSNKLIKKLQKYVGGPEFDIFPLIKYCTLDIICETAMGISINAQDKQDSEYVKAIGNMTAVIVNRSFKPWLFPDFMFKMSDVGRLQEKSLKIIHSMTNEVITSRKAEIHKQKLLGKKAEEIETEFGIKERKAFLDLLLESVQDEESMTDEELREEVDTFMFEGHDTTTSAISFALSSLALHPDIQDKVYEEQRELFGDSDREPTTSDIQSMKYLEMVIKETLRLYPSVPVFVRELERDAQIDGYTLPKGAQLVISPFVMHRNPKFYTDPEVFDPDRFLPENSLQMHPFLFVPFSAGVRNCIGQKFAMLQMKTVVSKFIRSYELVAGSTTNKLEELTSELVLKNVNGIKIKILSRKQKQL